MVLLEPLAIPPHTPVEVWITEDTLDAEQVYWQRLVDLGLIKEIRPQPKTEPPYEPVRVTGPPISQTIVEERR